MKFMFGNGIVIKALCKLKPSTDEVFKNRWQPASLAGHLYDQEFRIDAFEDLLEALQTRFLGT